MSATFSTIDEYIQLQPANWQEILLTLHQYILSIAPQETTTAISYKIPTYRYNGNLIHFALYKNHIGIYPGAEALEACKTLMANFKTSKGALQIPLNQPIPTSLIKALITYNVRTLKNKKGPNWHQERGNWSEANELMESIIIQFPTLHKTHKWGADVYTYKGKNTIAWGGFKDFFSIWFYNGVFMPDPLNVLITASEGKTKSLRQWRFKSFEVMDIQQIKVYIQHAIKAIEEGQYLAPAKPSKKEMEEVLKLALSDNKALQQAFEKLSLGKQNEYITYIEEAKQAKTKESRILKITPMIMEGKGLHDKYKK